MIFFFKIINFAIVIGLFYYLFAKIVIPYMVQQMQAYKIYVSTLQTDYYDLKNDNQIIKKNIEEQQSEFSIMQSKFEIWQQVREQKLTFDKQERAAIIHIMQERFVLRCQYIGQNEVLQKQIPIIINDAKEALQLKYHQVNEQKKYTDDLLYAMKVEK